MADAPIRIEPNLTGAASFPGAMSVSGMGVDPAPQIGPPPRIAAPETYLDMTTVLALVFSMLLIAGAIAMGNTDASFVDVPSILIVILGTIAVTCMSYTARELRLGLPMIRGSVVRNVFNPTLVAREMLEIAILSRKKGILQLPAHIDDLENHPFLSDTLQMVADGFTANDIDRLTHQEIDGMVDRYRRAAGMLRRASEIAPAMGLIGTLIGLVQMLVALDDPGSIGPAMALALITTFYGAIMGSVVLAPLAAKLERNANEDVLIKTLVQTGALAIVAQENPRKLELELNALLPPDLRVHYFDT